jgi:hypothetical protein
MLHPNQVIIYIRLTIPGPIYAISHAYKTLEYFLSFMLKGKSKIQEDFKTYAHNSLCTI